MDIDRSIPSRRQSVYRGGEAVSEGSAEGYPENRMGNRDMSSGVKRMTEENRQVMGKKVGNAEVVDKFCIVKVEF
jgi:hypothetical protein